VATTPERYGLGRLVEHPESNRDYPVPRLLDQPTQLRSVRWRPRTIAHVLDQGSIGACVAFTGGDLLNSKPLHKPRDYWTSQRCLDLYSRVTALDEFPGSYPPNDTGSSALGLYRALKEAGEASRIEWAFGIDHALEALQRGPVAFGIPWKTQMFTPDSTGCIRYTGTIEGGHELAAFGYDHRNARIWLLNHWTPGWGVNGWAWITPDDMAQALADEGDAAQLIR
jgi:hypothetical protein